MVVDRGSRSSRRRGGAVEVEIMGLFENVDSRRCFRVRGEREASGWPGGWGGLALVKSGHGLGTGRKRSGSHFCTRPVHFFFFTEDGSRWQPGRRVGSVTVCSQAVTNFHSFALEVLHPAFAKYGDQ